MIKSVLRILLLSLIFMQPSFTQTAILRGVITSQNKPVAGATIWLEGTQTAEYSDLDGNFTLKSSPGKYKLIARYIGYRDFETDIVLEADKTITLNIALEEENYLLQQVVVTGTKTFKRKTESPVMVNILDNKTLTNLQVCNLSESLKFQPGLRVETDCQTCNYTQLRMNGLAGGYSQILINGRPIFSPLMSLYGMEQMPVNMIDRIEVVRGGGSTLYGSSAIAGTVNVITRIPDKNSYELNTFYQQIDNQTPDFFLNGNASIVNKDKNSGMTFFVNHRNRGLYDANTDHFSELPALENTSFGTSLFIKPSENQKLEINISNLNEYRFGGDMKKVPVFLTRQAEERKSRIWLGSADYQVNFNEDKSSFIAYGAWQQTWRSHYTGILPDEPEALGIHMAQPPFGNANTTTLQGGIQLNHKIESFLGGANTLTVGSEYVTDEIEDKIDAYRYYVNQYTADWGTFIQSDWEIRKQLNLLSGLRLDKHNLLDHLVWSPRFALLYKWKNTTQFRLSYGTGFRAPQAFDTDLHIAFAGGGVSRVQLSDQLSEERSQSISASVNYDKATENYVFGYTLEAFRTSLSDAFVLTNTGRDTFGEIFLKENGNGASVQGLTLELRANWQKKIQLETGFTLQKSVYEVPVTYIDGTEPLKEFLRTPDDYGFANLTWTPAPSWNINGNYVYTGRMKVAHFGGAENFPNDALVISPRFSECNVRISYTIPLKLFDSALECYGGIKNVLNAYQDDFDIGKFRDSNYVYGPAMPRSLFIGIKLRSI